MVRKSRKQKGGGYTFGQAVAPEAPYAQEVIHGTPLIPDCLAATRPGLAGPIQGTGGLPGFEGGAALNLGSQVIESALKGGSKMNVSTNSPVLNGGALYSVDVGQGPVNGIGSAGPTSGSLAVISRGQCEGGLVDTRSSGPVLSMSGGTYNDNQAYYAPTAGYSNKPSDFVDSVGGPVQLQIPYDARQANPACLKTGGRRKLRKSKRSKRSNRRKSLKKSNRK
jgi:hypothetical protein